MTELLPYSTETLSQLMPIAKSEETKVKFVHTVNIHLHIHTKDMTRNTNFTNIVPNHII